MTVSVHAFITPSRSAMEMPSSLTSSSSAKPLYTSAAHTHSSWRPSRLFFVGIGFLVMAVFAAIFFVAVASNTRSTTPAPHRPSTISPGSSANNVVPKVEIAAACNATRFPEACFSSLAIPNLVPPNPSALEIIQSSLQVSSQNIRNAQTALASVLVSFPNDRNLTVVAKICLEVLNYSQCRISQANASLPSNKTKDARAWMSASLSYVYDCSNGLRFYYKNGTTNITAILSSLDESRNITSNAISMLVSYDLHADNTTAWSPPRTERDGFWEIPTSSINQTFSGGVPSGLKADAEVCKGDIIGCYKTVQDAVNAAPSNASNSTFVIHIAEGVYDEIVRVPFDKNNVVFIGDGMNKTIISGSLSVSQPGMTTYESATVGVLGDGFMAANLTFRNTAGVAAHQAVAFRSDSDKSVIENCEFIGNQDTLYAHTLRQYYKSCRIEGNIDFIFGNAAAVFEGCLIQISPTSNDTRKTDNGVICASGRVDPAQSTGFVFLNCSVKGTYEYMTMHNASSSLATGYLGRPWKEYARTVYINCSIAALISPQGWMPWNGDFALNSLYFGEYGTYGLGSNVSQRVPWSNQILINNVDAYSVPNFIQGDEWIPSST